MTIFKKKKEVGEPKLTRDMQIPKELLRTRTERNAYLAGAAMALFAFGRRMQELVKDDKLNPHEVVMQYADLTTQLTQLDSKN